MPLSKEITENRLRRTCGGVQPTIQFYLCIIMQTNEHEIFFLPILQIQKMKIHITKYAYLKTKFAHSCGAPTNYIVG